VDPEFGTGVVMICTFGDRQDVRWWKKHNLPLRVSIDERGRMTAIAGVYEGMDTVECRSRIISDLADKGLLKKRERIKQNVGVCWRCKTPIEIISTRQWFVRVNKAEILDAAKEIRWYPAHFRSRLENWVQSMDWDWCISRQRIFSVPIPVWYCKRCGAVKVASEAELPIDPVMRSPDSPCSSCGGTEFEAEEDVLDTWMDSSLTALWIAGWRFDTDTSEFEFPVDLRPQGHDIIRTWAFYSILRSLALTHRIPWRTVLINGMVLGEDGYKMSKSRNNTVSPDEVIQKYGADVFRQWAAIGGATGSDVQFRWKDIIAASKFMQKLWSILRFSLPHLAEYDTNANANANAKEPEFQLEVVDRWLLSKLSRLVSAVTDSMENFQFDEAMKSIRSFAWYILADNYIELVKSRLYGHGRSSSITGKESARYALYQTLKTLSLLLAPFIPFFAEEMYSYLNYNSGANMRASANASVHRAKWPTPGKIDIDAEAEGDLIAAIVQAVRRYKSERGIALNAPLNEIIIFTEDKIDIGDIENATATKVELRSDADTLKDKDKDENKGTIVDINVKGMRIMIIN